MVRFFKEKIKNNFEVFALIIIIIITTISTTYYNYKKNINQNSYNNFVDNIYLKKTLNHFIENLEPKYKKIKHKIVSGETFDKILEGYLVDKDEIIKIKTSLNNCKYNKLVGIIEPFCSISYVKCKNLRREVWTVKVTKICRTHFNIYINFILRIYTEASVRRF